MAVKDLPLSALKGQTTTVGQFINIELDNHQDIYRVVVNPEGKNLVRIENPWNAVTYLRALYPLPFDYKEVRVGARYYIDVTNIGFYQNAALIKKDGVYARYDADGRKLSVATILNRQSDRLFVAQQKALDTMLEYRTEIYPTDARSMGAANLLWKILEAPDRETALQIRKDHMEAARQRRRLYREAVAQELHGEDGEFTITLDNTQVVLSSLPRNLTVLPVLNGRVSPMPLQCATQRAHNMIRQLAEQGYEFKTAK